MIAGGPRKRWLFFAHNRLAEPALAEVLEACRGREEVEPWFTRGEAAGAPLPSLAAREISIAEASGGRWDAVLATDNQRDERVPPGYRVRIPHGAAYGLHGYGIVSLPLSDLFVAVSEAHRAFLERHRPLARATTEIAVGGHPRLDRLWRERRGREEVLEGLGLDPGRPTVAITSHWTPDGNLRRLGAALARTVLAALPEANVLQTGHPNLWKRVRYDIGDPRAGLGTRLARRLRRELFPFDYDTLFGELGAIAEQNGRFRLLEPERTFEALAAADVLVSDLSSVTVEFTLFDRPIVLFERPGFHPWDPALAAAYRGASHLFHGLEGVGPALVEGLGAPAARRAGRAALRDLCLAHLGHAGERIVSLVLERS